MVAAGAWIALAAAPLPFGGRRGQDVHHAGPVVSPSWVVGGEGRGTPAADATTAYFLSKRHQVIAVDLATGDERWRAGTSTNTRTSPETMGGRVIRVGEVIVAGDYDVVGLDHRTGALRWRFAPRAGYGAGMFVGRSSGHDVWTGSAAGYLHAIDARSGRARRSVKIAAGEEAMSVFGPVVAGDLVVASFTEFSRPARGGVVALDRETGRERWRRRFPAWITRSAATGAAGEPVLTEQEVVASSQDGTIFGLDRATGAVRWVIPAGVRPDGRGAVVQDFRPVVLAGRTLVAGSLTGMVVAYDLESRRERWRQAPVPASVAFGLAADTHVVYVPYLSGHLVAIDVDTGVERWRAGGSLMGLSWPPLVTPAWLLAAGSSAGFLAFAR
jgi:outer membrane protein assembly factor BamB